MEDKIEVLSVDLLDRYRPIVNEFKNLSRKLGHRTIGWSYFLEWSWVFGQIDRKLLQNQIVLEAGAGFGLSQWYLAEYGATVYSVDRNSRACLPFYFRKRYFVSGVRDRDFLSTSQFLNPFNRSVSTGERIHNALRSLKGIFLQPPSGYPSGKILIYNQDLAHLSDIPDESIDLIISISSLEHNTPQNLDKVVLELIRILKPGGTLIATLAATNKEDWFHKPSSSWCYSDKSLIRLFRIDTSVKSNYSDFDKLMVATRANKELQHNLSFHYFLGSHNGMPWGRWNPVYLPVGIVKVKK